VLALTSPKYRGLTLDTLALLPSEVAVATWDVGSDEPASMLEALAKSMHLAGAAAKRAGYDAGRPGVPEFGHRLYELVTMPDRQTFADPLNAAVDRKARVMGLVSTSSRTTLETHCREFQEKLVKAQLAGVVLDYDGTVVETSARFDDIPAAIAAQLNRLLAEGMLVGIATGRGKSVHCKLRGAIAEDYWEQCWVGYYNGSVIRSLSDGCDDLCLGTAPAELRQAEAILRSDARLQNSVVELRPTQLTLTCTALNERKLWVTAQELLERAGLESLKIVRSSHSIDVIPRRVSKAQVVSHLAALANVTDDAILKIGDRGRWPGNDSEFLAMSHGLSVDEVSGDHASCWNLAPVGVRGIALTERYLTCIQDRRYRDDHGR
jgi:hydroxymethylpyrimidine pyrophosphatase-like HAD family hydrolase